MRERRMSASILDYQVATPGMAARAVGASIYKDERFSDHAPLTVEYDTLNSRAIPPLQGVHH